MGFKRQVITAACKTFVDDLRSVAATKKLSWYENHCIETVVGYLGLQDATINRRPNSQTSGELTGSITLSLKNVGLCVTVSEKKWGISKEIICDMLEKFNHIDHLSEINLKEMAQKTEFLAHLDMAYLLIMPLQIVLYLNMNSWRPKIDREGWKLSKQAYYLFINAGRRQGHMGYSIR